MKVATTLFSLSTPRRNRDELLDHFNKTLRMHELVVNKLSVERRGLIDYAYDQRELSSGNDHNDYGNRLAPQDRINIRNLKLDCPYLNKFIVCRVMTGSYQMATIMTVVEDPFGDVERLCISNWGDISRPELLAFANRSYIPIGSILALVNPKFLQHTDGFPLIRLEKPTDLLVLNNHHPLLFGISWSGGPSKLIPGFVRTSPKMKRYLVGSAQSTTPTSGFNSMNLLLTPPSSGSRSRRRHHHDKKTKKNKSKPTFFTLLTNSKDYLSDRDSAILLGSCFLIFLMYLLY